MREPAAWGTQQVRLGPVVLSHGYRMGVMGEQGFSIKDKHTVLFTLQLETGVAMEL